MAATETVELQYHLIFPLPYRVLFLFGIGILGWASILHGLHLFGIDSIAIMELKTDTNPLNTVMPTHRSSPYQNSRIVTLYNDTYRIFFTYSSFCILSWVLFRLFTQGDPLRVDHYRYIPVLTAIIILITLLCPYRIMFHHEREKFTLAIRRCIFPAPMGPIHFSDVIFADIGTSFAKVFGEFVLFIFMLKPGNSILSPPVEDGWIRWVSPAVTCIPFVLRFRQCLIEYNLPDNDNQRPLLNALKYATSFPMIFLSAAQRIVTKDLDGEKGKTVAGGPWHGEHPLFRLWLLAAAINSLYSFWWDVTNDWGLDLMKFEPPRSPERQPPRPLLLARLHSPPLVNRASLDSISSEEKLNRGASNEYRSLPRPQSCFGLRSILLYPRSVYPVLIFVNLLLRLSWSIKLSTFVQSSESGSVVFFWLQVLELVRRYLWVFVRVEWEVIKKVSQPQAYANHEDDRSGDEGDFELIPNTPDPAIGS